MRLLRTIGASALLILAAAALCLTETSAQGPSSPNIILLLADDMGYADPSCFGGKAVRTPNLDALAASGVKLTDFYSASAVCTPSRAAILTGKYPLRFDIRKHFADDEEHLPRGTVTLPKLLKNAGYRTAHVGKWHLGGLHLKHIRDRANSIPGPREHGFDHYQCQNEEQPLRGKLGRERTLFRQGGTCLIRDEEKVTPRDPYYNMHFTTINGDEAVTRIEQFHREGEPFFVNVWFLVPHKPYEPAPAPHWNNTGAPDISDDQHRFRSMVAHMDEQVGKIVTKLEELGIRDNTFIFFTSDNGGAFEADIGPYKGGKTDLHEGGIRVPAIASWPARIPAGQVTGEFGHHTDLLPTFCEAAGISAPEVDGVSILNHLTTGNPSPERPTVFWQMDLYKSLQRHYPKPKPYVTEVARHGQWKLTAADGNPKELFDLESDPLEENNVINEHEDRAAKMTQQLREFLTAPRDRSGQP